MRWIAARFRQGNGVASTNPVTTAPFISAWPLGMNHSTFAARAPQLTAWCAREIAFAVISGATLLPSGKSRIDVL